MLLFLLVLFVVLPVVELYVIVQVAHVIHVLPTIGLLLFVSFAGAWLVKREGVRTWASFRAAIGEGRVPAKETADGALVLLGGALLLTPGFVSDVFGLVFVLPPTRALVRLLLTGLVRRRLTVVTLGEPPESPRGAPRDAPRRVRAERMPDRRAANEPPPDEPPVT